jgi:ubiquinol-cytochrome c reductase cytochrome c1 subunit
MKKLIATVAATVACVLAAPGARAAEGPPIEPWPEARAHDLAALQNGARIFANYCLTCHSANLMRWNRLQHIGLDEAQIRDFLIFGNQKVGDTMRVAMQPKDSKLWFGKAPPDLSLEVRAKTADWVYAYLNSFYLDPSRPVGWNNTVFPNASMPNPLWELQGVQTAVKKDGSEEVEKLELSKPGKMTPAQFQQATRDLTNFLEYVSEPAALQRKHYGIWVLLFLAGFTFLAYMLKKEYWKDVH